MFVFETDRNRDLDKRDTHVNFKLQLSNVSSFDAPKKEKYDKKQK